MCKDQKIKSNLHYTRGITQKRVTSGGARLRGLAPAQQRNVATVASRWRQIKPARESNPRPTAPYQCLQPLANLTETKTIKTMMIETCNSGSSAAVSVGTSWTVSDRHSRSCSNTRAWFTGGLWWTSNW